MLFVLPWIGTAFVLTPVSMLMPAFYASHAGVPLALLGAATAASRVLDALVDPLVGHLSDRTRSRFGPRRPWVVAGSAGLCLAVWQLFRPAPGAGIGWYLGWMALLYAAVACIETPMRAWGSELAREPVARARLFTQVGMARAAGSLAFWATPALALLLGHSGRLNDPGTLALGAVLLVAALPPAVALTLRATPVPALPAPTEALPPFSQLLRDAAANGPLRVFAAGYGLWAASSGAATAVTFFFLDDHLRLGGAVTPLLAAFFVVQIAAMPWWVRLLPHIEKHRLLALVWLADAALKPLLLFIAPGSGASVAVWALIVAMAVTGSVSYGIPHAVLADIVDLDTLRARRARPASFFALCTLLYKLAFGLGGSVALVTLGAGGRTPPPALAGLPLPVLLATIVVPGALLVAAAAAIWRLPLDARRHGVIARRLARLRLAATPAR